MNKLIEIRDRQSGEVLFSLFSNRGKSLREAAIAAIASGVSLQDANLRDAGLRGANLYAADLRGANLYAADLRGADLRGANLQNADLRDADLRGANLYAADLRGADLRIADLCGADLSGADLRGADIRNVNLYLATGASLDAVRDDIRRVLDAAPDEVPGLLRAIWDGRIAGQVYLGDCACLVGTIANIRGVNFDQIPGLEPDSSSPAEMWFFNIRAGDTPVTSSASAFAAAVVTEWLREREASQ